jgi:hypothetical protein
MTKLSHCLYATVLSISIKSSMREEKRSANNENWGKEEWFKEKRGKEKRPKH